MKQAKTPRIIANIYGSWKRIHLVDRCLLILMTVLMIQSIYTLFSPGGGNQLFGNIDIVIRTSTAAIFGYFLSANFAAPDESPLLTVSTLSESQANASETVTTKSAFPKNQIGFSADSGSVVSGNIQSQEELSSNDPRRSCKLQILVTAGIGLFCLGSLILLRDISPNTGSLTESGSLTATVTQFRDFVSGCVGFLIGCPTSQRG